MALWKKVIVSGSSAELADLTLDTALTPANGGLGLQASSASGFLEGTGTNGYQIIGSNGTGQVVRTIGARGVVQSGSYSGSFVGDGSGLTGISSAPTFTLSGSQAGVSFEASTDTLYFTTASAHGFDMSMSFVSTRKTISLITPQDLRSTATPTFAGINGGLISGSTLNLSGIQAGTDNSVVIIDSNGFLVTDEIDARVWGTSLVDGSGSATQLAVFSDANTAVGNANLTFTNNLLNVNGSTFGQDVVIAGDLTVLGDVIQLQIANLNVEDRFILMNSGSTTGDGGLVISSGSLGNGVGFGWDESAARWGIQQTTLLTLSSSALAPEAYMSAVFDIDGGQSLTNYSTRNGNIRVESGEIYIYA